MDKTVDNFEHHDVIYLQTGGEGYEDWDNFEYEGVTWCQDKINRNDTEYLLATPERKAADVMCEALEKNERFLDGVARWFSQNPQYGPKWLADSLTLLNENRAALELAKVQNE